MPVSEATNVSDVTVANGQITFKVLADPYVVVLAPSAAGASPAIPGATTPVTGVPILTDAAVGGVLVIGGLLLAVRLRRRAVRRVA